MKENFIISEKNTYSITQPNIIKQLKNEETVSQDSKKEKGQATVEFALLVPLIMLLLIGAIQFGLILQQYIAVVHLTREAGRYAVVNAGDSDSNLSNYILSNLVPPSLAKSNITISFSPTVGSRLTGTPVAVGIHYNLQGRLVIPTNFFGWQIPTTLPAYTVTMRVEKL